MRSISRELLTIEDVARFTDAELLEAKQALEEEIAKIEKAKPVTMLVINNDVGSRNTPKQIKDFDLKPHLQNLSLINEAIKNRQSVIDFMNTPDPDLDEIEQGPNQA